MKYILEGIWGYYYYFYFLSVYVCVCDHKIDEGKKGRSLPAYLKLTPQIFPLLLSPRRAYPQIGIGRTKNYPSLLF